MDKICGISTKDLPAIDYIPIRFSVDESFLIIGMRDSSKITALKEFPNKTTLLEMEMEVMEMIARDQPLTAVLNQVAKNFEKNIEGALCSILLLDKSGVHVLHGAAPSIPQEYNMAINGLAIGENRGSCGTAAYRKERIIVSDIATDPLWVDYKGLALKHGLKACWSTPILRNNGEVLGTFAIYYQTVKAPESIDLELIDRSANLVKIAIEQYNRAAELAESEEKYRSLTEGVPDAISRYSYDKEVRLIYTNAGLLKIIGLNAKELLGKTHREMGFDEDQVKFWDDNIKSVFKTGKPLHEQFTLPTVNGVFHFDWRLNPEFDQDGNVKSVLGVARDVTQLLETKKEIQKRERFLAVITDNIPNSFVTVVDKDLKVVFNGGEEFTKVNLDPEQFNGKHVAQFFKEYGVEKADLVVDSYLKTLKGEPQVFELELNDRYLLYKTVPLISANNEINSLLVVAEDVTKKRRAELALAKSELLFTKLTGNVPVGIFQTDLSGNCIYVNDELIKYAGISFEEAMGDGWIQAIHPDDQGRVLIEWQNAVSNKKEFKSEFRFLTRQGKVTWLSTHAIILFEKGDEVYGYIGMASDVTDQKSIQGLLEENEKRYRTTLERITDGFVALDKNWCYTYMNKKAGEIFAREPDTIIGKHIWTEFPEGIGQPFHKAYEKAMETQEYVYLEEYYPPYDSWFENHIYPSPEGLSIYFKDVTDRKKNEANLFAAIESLESAEKQAMLGSWELDVVTDKRKWSKQMFRFFGYKPGSEVPPDEDIIKRIHPEDKAICEKCFRNKKFTEEPNYFLIRTNPALLQLRYLLCQWDVEYNEQGEPIKLRGTLQDITNRVIAEKALKESEYRLRTILDNEPECVKIINKNGELVNMNPAGLAMIQADNLQEVEGVKVLGLVDEPYRAAFHQMTQNVFKGITGRLEFKLTGIKGRGLWLETHAVPFRDAEGKIVSLLAVTRDITERKIAEAKVIQYASQLKELTAHLQHIREEERAALSRELHDELGQQLTAIKMDLSWLNKRIDSEELNAKIKETMDITLDAVSSLRRINSELRPSILDDLGLFPALEHQINEFKKRYGVSCSLHISVDEPEFGKHHDIAIFRIFQESLTNIAKHAGATAVKVEIKEENKKFHMAITDNGNGFDSSSEGKARTFGIMGMRERAMMMNGTLTVKSKSGKGTTLHLIVPITTHQ